jgi:CheY-like chemotaxis protein
LVQRKRAENVAAAESVPAARRVDDSDKEKHQPDFNKHADDGAHAAPDLKPNTLIAAAIASSKKLLALTNAAGHAIAWVSPSTRLSRYASDELNNTWITISTASSLDYFAVKRCVCGRDYPTDVSIRTANGARRVIEATGAAIIVGHADTASTAIEGISTLHPDAVTIDISLKTGTGFDVLEAIRINSQGRTPLRIMLTNYTFDSYRNTARRLGADHFFDKARQIPEVLAVVGSLRKSGMGNFDRAVAPHNIRLEW